MIKRILISFILLGTIVTNSFSQVKLLIDVSFIQPPGQAHIYGDTLGVTVLLKALTVDNVDTTAVGNIIYWYQTDLMKSEGLAPRLVDDNPAFETITQGGILDLVNIIIRPEEMRTGPINVIIIWPSLINPNVDVLDSGFSIINNDVYGHLGMDEETFTPSNVYPNPAVEFVYINSYYAELIEQVQIINSLGQPVYQVSTGNIASGGTIGIPTSHFAKGLYYINILYKDHTQETVKFMKQ